MAAALAVLVFSKGARITVKSSVPDALGCKSNHVPKSIGLPAVTVIALDVVNVTGTFEVVCALDSPEINPDNAMALANAKNFNVLRFI